MDRVQFFESISGIDYPNMLVDFFDHFLALKEIVENSGKINVPQQENTNNHIIFDIEFSNSKAKETAVDLISNSGSITIYNRPIYVNIIGLPVDDLNKVTIELY
jgi:hypothetical protein